MANINGFHSHGAFGMVKLESIHGDDLGMVYCYTKLVVKWIRTITEIIIAIWVPITLAPNSLTKVESPETVNCETLFVVFYPHFAGNNHEIQHFFSSGCDCDSIPKAFQAEICWPKARSVPRTLKRFTQRQAPAIPRAKEPHVDQVQTFGISPATLW